MPLSRTELLACPCANRQELLRNPRTTHVFLPQRLNFGVGPSSEVQFSTFYRRQVRASLVEETCSKKSKDSDGSKRPGPIARERLGEERVRSYWLDDATGTLLSREEGDDEVPSQRNRAAQSIANFVLPAGFPRSVSPDYLSYMLWQFPTNVTGWICHTLVTSSLFKAVGISDGGGTYAAAATATIKWVSKDGLGAVGQIILGGRFGNIFDEDPKQWRMYADVIGSAGSIFELFTPLAPDQFLLLASLGHLTKAVAKGLKDPSFRVIQNHFAATGNVGDVSAKEEVWEVAAKLVGLAAAVLLLSWSSLGLSDSYSRLVILWVSTRTFHLFLRHKSLSMVQLETINLKRAVVLIRAHLEGCAPLPDVTKCNLDENILLPSQFMTPRVWVGCSLHDIVDLLSQTSTGTSIQDLLHLYSDEDYVLVFHRNDVRVLVKEGITRISVLRSLWQAHWLHFHCSTGSCDGAECLRQGLDALNERFPGFVQELENSGWKLDQLAIKVPSASPVMLQ